MESLLQEISPRSDNLALASPSDLRCCLNVPATYEVPKFPRDAPLIDFQRSWRQGIPVVVTGVHTRLQGDWAPDYFIQRYGTQKVTLVDCETDYTQQTTVSDFFRHFNSAGDRRQILKLKVIFLLLIFFA
jgi:hypothetical protein